MRFLLVRFGSVYSVPSKQARRRYRFFGGLSVELPQALSWSAAQLEARPAVSREQRTAALLPASPRACVCLCSACGRSRCTYSPRIYISASKSYNLLRQVKCGKTKNHCTVENRQWLWKMTEKRPQVERVAPWRPRSRSLLPPHPRSRSAPPRGRTSEGGAKQVHHQ